MECACCRALRTVTECLHGDRRYDGPKAKGQRRAHLAVHARARSRRAQQPEEGTATAAARGEQPIRRPTSVATQRPKLAAPRELRCKASHDENVHSQDKWEGVSEPVVAAASAS